MKDQMANSFFSATKNASVLGFLFIIIGIVNLLELFTSGNLNPFILLGGVISIIVGFGLRKKKLWGVYAIGISAIFSLISLYLAYNSDLPLGAAILGLIFQTALFFWFYSAKKDFT